MIEETIYRCEYCGKTFDYQSDAYNHEVSCNKCNNCEHAYYVYGCEFNCKYYDDNSCINYSKHKPKQK